MGVKKKLNDLENRVLKMPEFGTSKIYMEDAAESQLLEACQAIRLRYLSDPEQVTERESELVYHLGKIMTFRAYDLFRTTQLAFLQSYAGEDNDALIGFTFDTRLLWFQQETLRHAEQLRVENELQKAYPDFKDFEREYKKYRQHVENKTRVWSEASWQRFWIECIKPAFLEWHDGEQTEHDGADD